MRRTLLRTCLAVALGLACHAPSMAQMAAKGASGLPLPRFVSLKSKRVNLRIGPGTEYAVTWMYTRAGLPVEIIQEYENWRKNALQMEEVYAAAIAMHARLGRR